MRSSLFVIVALLALATTARAEVESRFGVKIGWNRATFRGEAADAADVQSVNHLLLGGVAVIKFHRHVSFQPEFIYTIKGAEGDALVFSTPVKEATLNYFEIPLLLKFHMPNHTRVEPHVFLGPAIGLNLSSDAIVESGGVETEIGIDEIVADGDLGFVFGGGFGIAVGTGSFLVDGRYTIGSSNIVDSGSVVVKNGVFSVSVGYVLGVTQQSN